MFFQSLDLKLLWDSCLRNTRTLGQVSLVYLVTLEYAGCCANVQADLNLQWAHMSKAMFSDVTNMVVTQMKKN